MLILIIGCAWFAVIIASLALDHAYEQRLRQFERDHAPDDPADLSGAGGGEVRFIHNEGIIDAAQ